MKKASILACSLLFFVSIAGFGQTRSQPPLTKEALAMILGLPASSSCATRPAAVRQVAAKRPGKPSGKSDCNATANCGTGTPVSCIGTGSCVAVDRDCSTDEPGYVNCDGVITPCQPTQCDCSTLTGNARQCCTCDQTGDCIACCRCDGFSLSYCSLHVCF